MTGLVDRLQEALSGRYQLEREVGRGGMATVHLAQDLKHRRAVAVKVLHPELSANVGADRFLIVTGTAFAQHDLGWLRKHLSEEERAVVQINDLTSGQSGSMTASTANGFAHIDFAPSASTCTETSGAWHPSYSTSSEHTRVPWAAHSYNVAFSDEIGHFEYCDAVSSQGGACTQDGVGDLDNGLPAGAEDDFGCFAPPFMPPFQSTRVKIGGCLATDFDFDGVSYKTTWPGSLSNAAQDAAFNPQPIRFASPLFNGTQAYDRVAFEADLPRIELNTNPPCNRSTGANCVNPPVGASFYPIYSTTSSGGQCVWQLGGPYIPGTTNTFGGTSTAEYGSQLVLVYPGTAGPVSRINNFRNVLSSNPC